MDGQAVKLTVGTPEPAPCNTFTTWKRKEVTSSRSQLAARAHSPNWVFCVPMYLFFQLHCMTPILLNNWNKTSVRYVHCSNPESFVC